jgi:hypothetical protein
MFGNYAQGCPVHAGYHLRDHSAHHAQTPRTEAGRLLGLLLLGNGGVDAVEAALVLLGLAGDSLAHDLGEANVVREVCLRLHHAVLEVGHRVADRLDLAGRVLNPNAVVLVDETAPVVVGALIEDVLHLLVAPAADVGVVHATAATVATTTEAGCGEGLAAVTLALVAGPVVELRHDFFPLVGWYIQSLARCAERTQDELRSPTRVARLVIER